MRVSWSPGRSAYGICLDRRPIGPGRRAARLRRAHTLSRLDTRRGALLGDQAGPQSGLHWLDAFLDPVPNLMLLLSSRNWPDAAVLITNNAPAIGNRNADGSLARNRSVMSSTFPTRVHRCIAEITRPYATTHLGHSPNDCRAMTTTIRRASSPTGTTTGGTNQDGIESSVKKLCPRLIRSGGRASWRRHRVAPAPYRCCIC